MILTINGIIKTVLVNEYSKLTKVNENIPEQIPHLFWECPCGEVNIEFQFNKEQNSQQCTCERCKEKLNVQW